jgi:hypothetical protein
MQAGARDKTPTPATAEVNILELAQFNQVSDCLRGARAQNFCRLFERKDAIILLRQKRLYGFFTEPTIRPSATFVKLNPGKVPFLDIHIHPFGAFINHIRRLVARDQANLSMD